MKAWWTARELAEARLSGLPTTERNCRALLDGCEGRPRGTATRPTTEYHISALPERVRVAIEVRERRAVVAAAATLLPVPAEPELLAGWQIRARDARAIVLEALDALTRSGLRLMEARETLVGMVQGGLAEPKVLAAVPDANARGGRAGGRTLSVPTLRRWERLRAADGLDGLAPGGGKGPDRVTEPPWLPAFLKTYCRPQKPSIADTHEVLTRQGHRLPSVRSVTRTIKEMGTIARSRGRFGPRELRRFRAFAKRTFDHLLPADVYTADGWTADFEVAHPVSGRAFRPEITSVLDIASRRWVGLSVEVAESAAAVSLALQDACRQAVPAIFYTDNGSGYCAAALTAAVAGVLARLETDHRTALPYNSQARGVIERFHDRLKTRSRDLVTYAGHDMDPQARQLVFKRTRADLAANGNSPHLMTWDRFRSWLTDVRDWYNSRPHSGLPTILCPETGRRRHETPDEAWARLVLTAEADGITALDRLDDATAAALFRPRERRVVQRGCVSLGAKTYFAPALDELDMHGREVLVAYDPMETASVIIEGLDGRTICRADLDGHAAPYFPQSEIERARAKRAQGKLRRLEAKAQAVMDEIPADARPAPEPAPPTAEQVTAARRLQARNQPPIPPRPAAANDAEWAQQILADPELRLRPDQIAHWRSRLSKEVHRQALTARGVDINALKARLDTASHPTLLEASA